MPSKITSREYCRFDYEGEWFAGATTAQLKRTYVKDLAAASVIMQRRAASSSRRILLENILVDLQKRGAAERLAALVKGVLGKSVEIPDPLPLDAQLSDLGISSLKMVNLMLAVEIEFDIAIPQSDITPENFHSLATIEALVLRSLTSRGA